MSSDASEGGVTVTLWFHASVPSTILRYLFVPGKLYAVGGYDGASRQCLSTVEQYNPAANVWTYVADMSTRRSGAGTAGASGRRLCLICSQVGLETSNNLSFNLPLLSFQST